MKLIPLTQGKFAQVDDENFEFLSQFKWFAINYHGYFYAGTKMKNKVILMHRMILNTSSNNQVDHIDHNGLNNQKCNIRNCTVSQNAMNRNPYGKSKYKGVWFYFKKRNDNTIKTRIRSGIRVENKMINLGTFKTEEAAAIAYNEAAIKYFGEFAQLNIIE